MKRALLHTGAPTCYKLARLVNNLYN
jgi:hypothetical protein